MASSATGPTLAHRTVSNIRSGAGHSPSPVGQTGPGSPHTPIRGSTSSAFSSPSSLRADEETLVIELGSRYLRLGFAGDSAPKATLRSGTEEQRRAGDFTTWLRRESDGHPPRWPSGPEWSSSHEIWRSDQPSPDLGLVSDKLERALRDAFTHHLLIDSRPRRMCLVLPPAAPLPLLSTVLDTLFNRFQAPTISLVSSAVMAAVGAGVRSGLVVNIGWAETVVSSVYEYREVRHSRSIRGGRMLVREVHDMLASCLSLQKAEDESASLSAYVLSFEECEEVACRLTWARQTATPSVVGTKCGLSTVEEQDESSSQPKEEADDSSGIKISLSSCGGPPRIVEVPFRRLSDPCEKAFIAQPYSRASFDDEEVPLPQLIYDHLLALPIDARASCMSRIMFTGGCANIPGLKRRLFDEVMHLVQHRGWDPVLGKGADMVRARAKTRRSANSVTNLAQAGSAGGNSNDLGGQSTAGDSDATQGTDPIDRMLRRSDQDDESVRGRLRAIESLGSWTGASLAVQLRNVAVASVERDLWLQQGAQGASRASDVDMKAQQRQSLGPGLMRGASASANWTLGAWGDM